MQTIPLHSPARALGESQAEYRARQAASREAVKQMRRGGEERTPVRTLTDANGLTRQSGDPRGYWLGGHKNPGANARRAVKSQIGARQYRKQCKALNAAARVL